MTRTNSEQARLIGRRAEALATIALTRRGDTSIQANEVGPDFLVTIHHEEKPGLRQFAVEVKSAWAKATAKQANAALLPKLGTLLRLSPFPYPVVVFFYTMENGEGWYTWVAQPLVAPNGEFKLLLNETASCSLLDDQAVDEIIEQVDAWYDAFFLKTTGETPRKPRART